MTKVIWQYNSNTNYKKNRYLFTFDEPLNYWAAKQWLKVTTFKLELRYE